jgi:hypothetical protein
MQEQLLPYSFTLEERYLFVYSLGILNDPVVIVSKPNYIGDTIVRFRFYHGAFYTHEAAKEDIIAVRNDDSGTFEIKSIPGKFHLLNHGLYDKYRKSRVIILK